MRILERVALAIVLLGTCAAAPDDPRLPDQWHLAPHRQVTVALIDSGIDPTHEDLAANLWVNPGEVPGNGIDDDGNGYVDDVNGYDFVEGDGDPTDPCYGHGTSTAGVLGAVRDNGIGVAGAADDVRLMVLRVLGCGGTSSEQQLVDAIHYARDNGAQLIQAVVFVSAAWGIGCWDQAGCLPGLCQAIEESGLLFVSPSGNEGISLDPPTFRYPPSCARANQITVTASTPDDQLAPFASLGAQTVHLAAPGVGIWTTVQRTGNPLWTDASGYKAVDGASYATPQVAALAARLLWLDPSLDAASLRARVLDHVEVLPAFADTVTGGRLRAFFGGPAAPADPEPVGLVLHLPLDDASGTDTSGAGNHLSCTACPGSAPGLSPDGGGSADFSGAWLERPDAALRGAFPSHGAQSFSIAAWVELDHVDDRQPLASKQGEGDRGWALMASPFIGGRLRMELWSEGASTATVVDGQTPLAPGSAHHVAVTLDAAGFLTLYVDGVAEASQTAAPPRDNRQPLDLGRYHWSSAYERRLDGRLDDVRFYDHALSAQEVADLASGAVPEPARLGVLPLAGLLWAAARRQASRRKGESVRSCAIARARGMTRRAPRVPTGDARYQGRWRLRSRGSCDTPSRTLPWKRRRS